MHETNTTLIVQAPHPQAIISYGMMIARSLKPGLLSPLRFAGTTNGHPVVWNPVLFINMGLNVANMA